ncbi:MAG: PAS domain-containing hybrid sensor histidine kinase/response regulator [Panacagrimonas sp.]
MGIEGVAASAEGCEVREQRIDQLERELAATRGKLENTVRELECANAALKSSSEERSRDTEQRLRASEQIYRAIGESLDYGVWVCNPDGRNIYASESFLRLTGMTQAQCSDFGWGDVLHPEDAQRTIETWKDCVQSGGTWDIEHRFKGVDGEWHPILARGVPVRDADGSIYCWAGINLDISRQKRAEQSLIEIDRRKDEFLAMLAHELRNPLSAIVSANRVAAQPGADAKMRQWSQQVVERQARQLTRLVDDLLDVSRISSGKIHLQKEALDAAQVLRRAIEGIRPAVELKSQTLTVEIPDEPLPVEADSTRLEQIFVNVLNNATKYCQLRGEIVVSAGRDGGFALVRVRDNGIGIAAEMLPRVFDAFIQADGSLDRAQGGLGLGLTVVKRLLEEQGGFVRAHSGGLGEGSEFVLGIPLRSGSSAIEKKAVGHGTAATGATPRRVLLVEDNLDAAEAVSTLLESVGHTVHTLHDGRDAIATALVINPDVVLLDLGLPGLDGYAVAQSLRRQDACAHCLIVAISGYGQASDRERSRDAGIDHHLVKPVDFDLLLGLLQSAPAAPEDPKIVD